MSEFSPRLIAFVCNWCSYGGADNAGQQKYEYPANLKLIRVMCSGRVDPQLVLQAFRKGADGVMLLGCHPGDCHYRTGNMKAKRRFAMFEQVLGQLGIEPARFKLDWVAASEGKKFQEVAIEMTERIARLGPFQFKAEQTRP